MKASEKTEVSKVKEEMEIALAEWKADYYEENVSLEGRSATTASGATVSYEEEGIVYTAKKGSVYIGILDNGRIDKVNLVGAESNEEGEGTSLTDYEWTAKVPEDSWFAKDYYYNFKWDGEGTQESPYLIKTVKDLAGLSYKVATGETYNNSTYFKLMKDLNMKNHIWVPIGGHTLDNVSTDGKYYGIDTTKIFKGNFDGNGFYISGIYYNNTSNSYGTDLGVFGRINGDSNNLRIKMKNLSVIDSFIKGAKNIGGIIGFAKYIIVENCEFNGTIEHMLQGDYFGGLLGSAYNSNVANSTFSGIIFSTGSGSHSGITGGIAGYTKAASVVNCLISRFNKLSKIY